jgi:hypothetical protein
METSGPGLWLILLTIGVIVLGAAAIYGIMRNRQRTPAEKITTEAATKREYQREDRDET